MIIKNYKYDYSSGRIYYTIDVDGYEQALIFKMICSCMELVLN